MFKKLNLTNELKIIKQKNNNTEDELIVQTKKILQNDIIYTTKILNHLPYYNKLLTVVSEEECDTNLIFSINEIKEVAINNRLRFLERKYFKNNLPYEAKLKILDIEKKQLKQLSNFFVLAPYSSFKIKNSQNNCLLFSETNYGNFYLIHNWGNQFKQVHKLIIWPLKNFETLFISLLIISALITLTLPNNWLTNKTQNLPYWNVFRFVAFLHLLIVGFGVSVYYIMAFSKNLSNTIWNSHKEFDRK
ncbi:MAG: hypothetical protein LCH32_05275 [Bacteroidetes bacterium]|nr:hypothetical protein [Bacteroidota bacterium]